MYWDSGTAVSGNWSSFNAVFDHNVYWAFGKGQMKFAGMDWDADDVGPRPAPQAPHAQQPGPRGASEDRE